MIHFMVITQTFVYETRCVQKCSESKNHFLFSFKKASLDGLKIAILFDDIVKCWSCNYKMCVWHITAMLSVIIHSVVIVLFLQVYADDVLTKEEQIGLLFRAKRKCEGNIKSKHKVPGE